MTARCIFFNLCRPDSLPKPWSRQAQIAPSVRRNARENRWLGAHKNFWKAAHTVRTCRQSIARTIIRLFLHTLCVSNSYLRRCGERGSTQATRTTSGTVQGHSCWSFPEVSKRTRGTRTARRGSAGLSHI